MVSGVEGVMGLDWEAGEGGMAEIRRGYKPEENQGRTRIGQAGSRTGQARTRIGRIEPGQSHDGTKMHRGR